jgi:hypothetical protein
VIWQLHGLPDAAAKMSTSLVGLAADLASFKKTYQ